MNGLSNYTANKVNDHVFGNVPYTPPATIYAAMSIGSTIKADDGTTFPEANYVNYVRIPLTNNLTNFPASVSGSKVLGVDITFPVSGGTTNIISELVFLDAATGGNIVGVGTLTVQQTVAVGNQPVFEADEIEITVV
ncbi:MAG: hypothetical protein KKB34_05130 [Bacteroidetes bacterium]|nr:hypothetical protein [Bacteroidota bacterium]